jgi:hypothetical protein
MDTPALATVADHFVDLPDPRTGPAVRHVLLDIVTIEVCAVLCGADTWVDVAEFGRSKEPRLRTFLALPHGIPSHETFGRVFAALDPAALETAFLGWVRDQAAGAGERVVAIDGKTSRRSHDRANSHEPLHLVSAWATDKVLAGRNAIALGKAGGAKARVGRCSYHRASGKSNESDA